MVVSARHVGKPVASATPDWPWHRLSWRGVSVNQLARGERRMEAERYLAEGWGLRQEFSRSGGWQELGVLARAWQPLRLKGITVSPSYGTPFLAATQVFDVRPVPRKWLSLDRTSNAQGRFLAAGTIVVSRSGAVGRATLTYAAHEGTLISDDLLRVEPYDRTRWGWLYAFLRSAQARAMMSGERYGHMIKHLEPAHLHGVPVPDVSESQAQEFQARAEDMLSRRERAYGLALAAEERFASEIGPMSGLDWSEDGFSVNISDVVGSRRRLDASRHNPCVSAIARHLVRDGRATINIKDAGFDVWVPGRYKRVPAADGVVYLDSAEILEINPDEAKRLVDCSFGDSHDGRVESGWLLMPCSGQVYGIIGTAVLASDGLCGRAISNHVLRIAPTPTSTMRIGYLATALGHPELGRPLVKALAFGSSVPELDPVEVSALSIVRLADDAEDAIADLAERAAAERGMADVLERKLAEDAGEIVTAFLSRSAQCSHPVA
jgi:hypothetical protein